jgi:hypothetical protein
MLPDGPLLSQTTQAVKLLAVRRVPTGQLDTRTRTCGGRWASLRTDDAVRALVCAAIDICRNQLLSQVHAPHQSIRLCRMVGHSMQGTCWHVQQAVSCIKASLDVCFAMKGNAFRWHRGESGAAHVPCPLGISSSSAIVM